MSGAVGSAVDSGEDVWRALSNPVRRHLLDLMSRGPQTTSELALAFPELSRFAVMQHLGVLTDAGLIVVRRRGRHRFNHLNPVPLRRWYERWVVPLADRSAAELLALKTNLETGIDSPNGDTSMSAITDATTDASPDASPDASTDELRTVRIEAELRFHASPDRVFQALTEETRSWFPHTYGGDRVQAIVMEPRVGGAHFEDWGDGMGHLYGHVTVYDRPYRLCLRGRIMPGSMLDTEYTLEPDGDQGDQTVLRMSKVAVGPMTADEADGIRTFGDISRFEDALRALVEA
ncbi:MAG TPA: helix-turn-helix domain-containing protein [Nocardioidaceae bacterium]